MTYRIVKGELYHVVGSSTCHFQGRPCAFYDSGNVLPCNQTIDPDTLTRPCMRDGQSIIFFTDEQMLKHLSVRLTQ